MKKILCLAITVAMILSFAAIPAFAADVTATLAITGDTGKVGDFLTLTYTIKGADTIYAWQGIFTYAHNVIVPARVDTGVAITYKTDGTATSANAKRALISSTLSDVFTAEEYNGDYEECAIWGQTGVAASYNSTTNVGKYTVYASAAGSDADGSAAIVSAEGYTAYSVKFVRVAEGDINVALATGTEAPVVETTNLTGNVLTSSSIDYTAPGGSDEPVDWKTTVGTEAPAEASFDADNIQFKADPAAPEKTVQKKVTVFAKNTTGATLVSETYGVQIGNAFYPGVGDVEDGKYWAVILVDTDGTFLSETSYSYTAKVGSEEAAAGTVNVQ